MSRRFRFNLRHAFVVTTVVALIAFLLARSWHRTQARREYLNNAGAVNGHATTIMDYQGRVSRTVSGWLFRDNEVMYIQLYPGTSSPSDLDYIRWLFPEAEVSDSEDLLKSKIPP